MFLRRRTEEIVSKEKSFRQGLMCPVISVLRSVLIKKSKDSRLPAVTDTEKRGPLAPKNESHTFNVHPPRFSL